jgi:predicted porin
MIQRKALLAASVGAALAVLAASAQALEVKLSGQVNRGVMHVDDGVDSEVFHVDNDNSSTRFRFTGTEQMTPGIRAGLIFEVEYQSAPSNVVNFLDRTGPSPTLDERYMDLFFEGHYGKLSLGQGDGAANGAVEVDLSGTSVAHFADVPAIGGGFEFRTPGAGFSGTSLGDALSQQDFESRYDRLRYDTPLFSGLRVAASTGVKGTGDVREIALWYSGDLGARGRLAGAIGFSEEEVPGGPDDETQGGSVSWLHPSGFNLTFGHTRRDLGPRDGKFTYLKAGYKWDRHAVSADYAMGDDQDAAGDEASSFSIAYVFTPIAWAELFALVKQAELDRPGASLDDLTFVMVGTRLKF